MTPKILCATDFSDAATRSSDIAASLATKTGETLVLLHVCEPSQAADEALSFSLHHAAELRLRSEANRLRQTGAVVEELVLDGSPSAKLLGFLDENPARLLIVASRKKRSAPTRWFSGGLIERIVKRSGTPTLVIRDATVIGEWLAGTRPLRILVATGLGPASDIPLHWVKDLARIAPCEITATHLHWVPDEAIRLGLPTRAYFENTLQLQTLLENELRQKISEIFGDIPVNLHLKPRLGRADLPLIGIARAARADLIVKGTRRLHEVARLFDQSISLDLLHNAPGNIAIIPLLETSVTRPLPDYDNILVPTDFSDTANHAIPHACSVACPGATIHLLHVSDRFGVTIPEGRKILKSLIPEEAISRGLRFETITVKGEAPAETILQIAARRLADVICMGTSGKGALSKALIGSVASAVAASSPRPVLLIPKSV